ncbi:MAG: potassium/proton antiporter [Gemmatimonadota bacterium]|nr:potassium/proton antiporter [Gemmatimonadota bacterium]
MNLAVISEPAATGLQFAVIGALLAVSVILTRSSQKLSLPLGLLFIVIGIAAGSEGIAHIPFDDYAFAFRAGSGALVLILFDAGLNTPVRELRRVALPSAVLATVGVLGTAGIVASLAHLLGLAWAPAILLGAVVSPTDAAAVVSALRTSGTHLKDRIATTLEVESGLNDPMAVILTTVLTENLLRPVHGLGWSIAGEVLRHVIIGCGAGIALGYAGRHSLRRFRLPASGLYPVFTLAIALLSFAIPTLIGGSGFLGVYTAAIILGSSPLPYRSSLLRIHDALAWLAQVSMFLMLGMLVFPSRLLAIGPIGLAVALGLAFVARPVVVALCLFPFRYKKKEIGYIGWVGLRGAVPIILATFPVLSHAPGAERLFGIVFIVVVVNGILPGSTVAWLTRKLGLEAREPPAPPAFLQIESHNPLLNDLHSFFVDEALAVAGSTISELPMPEGSAVSMIIRSGSLIAATPDVRIEPGDHVYIVAVSESSPMIRLMFGRPESND